jgi:crotonobetainyl-CoA:carnitine CoA-transferase CaiB-like acyl-CoA transferase
MDEQAFSGVKILDLTQGIAGPYCTKLFSAFGAEVIKIENPDKGDISREMGPFPNDAHNPEKSGTFFYLNTNKKSITVDLRSEKGIDICKRLLGEMDVLVESFAPGGLAKLGLSGKVLKEINPRLIVTSISAFGKTGPYRNYKANNLTSSALGGAMHLMRPGTHPERRPVIQGGFQAEYSTGLLSYIATVAALIGRAGGGGASIDMAMMECVAATLMGHIAEYSYLGFSRRTNPFAIHGYPIGYSVPCRDGWISLTPGIGGAPNIPLLIGKPELQDDPLFTKTQTRMAEPDKFDGLIIPWLMNHNKWDITAEAQELRLAFTPVLSAGELFKDPQLEARKFFDATGHPELGDTICPGSPAKLSKTPWKSGRAPLLGEHNQEIFSKYGCAEINCIKTTGGNRPATEKRTARKLLDGIRILDLTMVFAGPVATKILAELGAEVIKIESWQRADVFTRANVYPENTPGGDPWNRGCLFHSLNAGKRGISLNLGVEKGREIFKRLAKISDAVIENFSPRVMENWGLNYEHLTEVNPRLIMASISGLGHYGPLRDYYMYVPGMEGMSGMSYNTGYPDEPPLLSGCAYGDWVAGANAAMALITALFHQMTTGKGQYVDISGREAAVCHIGDIVMDYALNNRDRDRIGNKHLRFAPHGCYRCRGDDDWVAIGIETDGQWRRFVREIGRPDLLGNGTFASMRGRLENQLELDRLIEEWTGRRDKFEIMETLQKLRIPAGAVLNMKEVNLNSHLKKRGFFHLIDLGKGIGQRPMPSQMPAKFRGFRKPVLKRAPHFGEDTEYVLGSLLGMSEQGLERLEEEKVIAKTPVFPPGKPTRLDLLEKQQAGSIDPDYLDELRKHFGTGIGGAEGMARKIRQRRRGY